MRTKLNFYDIWIGDPWFNDTDTFQLTTNPLDFSSYVILCVLGFHTDNIGQAVWPGGEKEALTRLDRHMERKAWIASFEKPKMIPQSLYASQTGVSPYLRFGCLSSRLFYWKLTELYMKVRDKSHLHVGRRHLSLRLEYMAR